MNSADFQAIAKACRHDSGRHFLDSGCAYGRHHEKPPISEQRKPVTIEIYNRKGTDCDITATLETAHFLAERCSIDDELTARFNEWAAKDENKEKSWFEAGADFCRDELGFHQHARDNVYNRENDLSQVYVWEVWTENEEESDWVWAKDALLVVYIHTGCDVRGGYSYPLFLRHQGDYAAPLDLVAEFGISEGRNEEGEELAHSDCSDLGERWQAGYSSCPSARVSEDVARVFWTGPDWFVAKLKSGEIVKVYAQSPYVG